MPRPRLALALAISAATALLTSSITAAAADDFVTLVDDGTIEPHAFKTYLDEQAIQAKLLALYDATGEPIPEVLSVWSTFPLGGDPYGTYFDPLGADVKGIGLQGDFPPDGTLTSPKPPLRSILFHNDVTQLAKRAAIQNTPEKDFARYLFLLEFTHNWGPALAVPAPNGGELVGFDFHWSFFMDAGGSPAGGNVWTDNGDGTFTTVAASPSTIAYSKVDLYLMGLATKAEVAPFGVLENVVAPSTPTDPLWGGVYAPHSFPWFDEASSLTVTATRRELTIDDVVTANGERDPAAGSGPTTRDLGIVLLVSGKASAAEVAAQQQTFAPIAASFAPSFHTATGGRGTLNVVTHPVVDATGSGGSGGSGGAGGMGGGGTSATTSGSGAGGATADDGGCGCETPGAPHEGDAVLMPLGLLGLAAVARRKRRLTSP